MSEGYKFLLFSDLHITNRNNRFRTDELGVSDLLRSQLLFVKWLSNIAVDREVDGILFLGDWTDYATLDPITLQYSNAMLQRLADTGLPVVLLEGNHCMDDKEGNWTVLGASSQIMNETKLRFVFKQDMLHLDEEVVFHCFPYRSDYDALEADISLRNQALVAIDDKINIMLFHFPTVNALLDNGLKSFGGVNLSEEISSNFDVIIGGDFHKPQRLLNNEKAFYVGAPFDLKYNQEGPRKISILHVSKDDYRVENIKNPYNYPMRSVTLDQLDKMDLANADQMIVKVTDRVSAEDRDRLNGIGFYKLSVVAKSDRVQEEAPDVIMVDSFVDDRAIFSQELDKFELEDDLKKRSVQIYEDLHMKGD